MTFYQVRKRSQGIPIIPMVDIVTILLLFFTQTTKFMNPSGESRSELRIKAPTTRYMPGEPSESDQILLELSAEGKIALNGEIIEKARLKDVVSARLRERPSAKVQCAVDKAAPMGEFIGIWDMLTAAGVDMEQIRVKIDFEKAD